MRHREALEREMEHVLVTPADGPLGEALDAAGVPSGPVNTYAQLFADPRCVTSRWSSHADDPELGACPTCGRRCGCRGAGGGEERRAEARRRHGGDPAGVGYTPAELERSGESARSEPGRPVSRQGIPARNQAVTARRGARAGRTSCSTRSLRKTSSDRGPGATSAGPRRRGGGGRRRRRGSSRGWHSRSPSRAGSDGHRAAPERVAMARVGGAPAGYRATWTSTRSSPR